MGGWKKAERQGTDSNKMSLVLKFTYSKRSWLFFGDLEGKDAFEELLKEETKQHLKTDVMMLPHHGAHLYLTEGNLPNNSPDYYQLLVDAGM